MAAKSAVKAIVRSACLVDYIRCLLIVNLSVYLNLFQTTFVNFECLSLKGLHLLLIEKNSMINASLASGLNEATVNKNLYSIICNNGQSLTVDKKGVFKSKSDI